MGWLVTGGAGYIGAHVVHALARTGIGLVVVDDLSSGRVEFVPGDVALEVGDIRDVDLLRRVIRRHRVDGVIHLAAFKYAGASVEHPLHTYEQNVVGTAALLAAMTQEGVDALVFSSSCAVYGTPDEELVGEDTPVRPESPYGRSKVVGEWLLRDQARATGLRHTSLRFFNVVGSQVVPDTSPHNLFPLVMDALEQGRPPLIFGDDYPTPDGTCVRDYVHVADIAAAHVAAAVALAAGRGLDPVYNLGSGTGVSVKEIVAEFRRVTGVDIEPVTVARRPGDPARVVASNERAVRDLDWQVRHGLADMVRSAWSCRTASGTTPTPLDEVSGTTPPG
ncbi:UDP-glucose 4-epimerase GalE [Nocardioides iriomotensis]|uniref:UDP-glucose 4-epimerase n=1 Tax=Nocardioides iriomotensis TaxID=715784 RepID=A0A4Q5J8N8_9ACTN|nr:UDP-glucose 4-epimerase GalE [Nocardioides iriomotensis]RYU15102.1 UDP-glucose 4-epimerase GalE [Nocardioides iriomotensis]